MAQRLLSTIFIVAGLALLGSAPAYADHLKVPEGAPLWVSLAASAILYAHIGGGAVGLFSGATALIARKGGKLHRLCGDIFVAAMLIMSGIGAMVAPFLHDRISTMAGFMTFYLVATAWLTARRREGVSPLEKLGLIVAAGGACWVYYLAWLASQTPEHTLDGAPQPAFYIFAAVTTIAAFGDLKLVLRGGISGAQRIARHVWRSCFGLFVSSGSLFLGQMQVFPVWLRHTPVLYVLALAPLPFLVFWMLRVRLSKQWRGRPARTQALAA
jgi:uncharacterized membrane protein